MTETQSRHRPDDVLREWFRDPERCRESTPEEVEFLKQPGSSFC